MRVLVLTHYFPEHGGGIERVAYELASRLAARGVSIEWLASAEPSLGQPLLLGAHPVPACNVFEKLTGVPYPLWGPSGILELRRAVLRCNILHLHDSLYMGNAVGHAMAR